MAGSAVLAVRVLVVTIIFSASGPANQWTPLSSRPCLPLCWRHCKWQGPFAPRTLLRFIATTDPAATLSSSADFPVSPVIRPTLLRRLGEMPLEAAAATVGHLVLGEYCEEAGRRPTFLVGLFGELGPHQPDARQAQLIQQEFDASGINNVRRHATASRLEVGLTARTTASSS